MMGGERCTVLSRGPAQWCGERGAFVQIRVNDGPQAGDLFELTAKDFAKHYRRIDGETWQSVDNSAAASHSSA